MANRELYCNDAFTTLSSAVTSSGQTTFVVTDGTGFPKAGNFRILIGTEICLVTAVAFSDYTPATWTVTRGVEGTTATTYSIGARVDYIITKGMLDHFFRDRYSTDASILNYKTAIDPPRVGDFFIPQDSLYTMVVFDGSVWKFMINGRAMTVPDLGSWRRDYGPDATSIPDVSKKYLRLSDPTPAYGTRGFYKAAPATPYTFTIACLPEVLLSGTSNTTVGIGWRTNEPTPRYVAFGESSNSGQWYIRSTYYSNFGTASSDYYTGQIQPLWFHANLVWMRLTDNGTNRTVQHSINGINWSTLHSVARTNTITPDNVYLHLSEGNVSTVPMGINVVHMEFA